MRRIFLILACMALLTSCTYVRRNYTVYIMGDGNSTELEILVEGIETTHDLDGANVSPEIDLPISLP